MKTSRLKYAKIRSWLSSGLLPCSLVEGYRRVGSACCLYLQGDEYSLADDGGNIELRTETSINFYQDTRHHNPEGSHLHTRYLENLKSDIKNITYSFMWLRSLVSQLCRKNRLLRKECLGRRGRESDRRMKPVT
jgi:hypothetical protein